MIWIDVDTAITVPVNILPLMDNTDFITRETGIVYNQTGMDLVWNFQTTDGVTTQTAITPTTAGDHDWTHSGDGMYKIEIPASGDSDEVVNDQEGFGWFTGICDGVLPWRGPVLGFRAAALNNALIAGGDTLDTNTTEISGDSTAADNLEAQFDGTGVTGDTFPSTQSQLSGLANVGSAVHRPAASYTLTTGTQSANTLAETEALDGTRHEHTDDAGAMDLYYEFNVGAGIPSSILVTGYINGNNDAIGVYGYDWVSTAYVQIGTMEGKAQSTNDVNPFNMFVDMVGSGVNSGVVRVRFYEASGLTSATLAIDQIFVEFNQSIEGYQNAAIWFDSNASNTNTVKGIDGTATNPVSTMTAVNTLLASTNLSRVEVISGSAITLSASQNDQVFSGENWILALGGQDIGGSSFIGAHVSGIASGIGTEQTFRNCHLDACTHLKETHALECGISGTQTAGEAGDYFFDRGHSAIAGTATWVFDFGTAIGDTNLNLRNYSGGVQLENMGGTGTDTASIEGRGQIIEGTCTGGIVAVRGLFTTSGITNLTLVDGARYESDTLVKLFFNELLTSANYNIKHSAGKIFRELKEISGYEGGFIYFDSENGSGGDEAFENGTLENPVDNMTDLNTLIATLGFSTIRVAAGSIITLAASQEKQVFIGEIWALNLGGQSISGSTFHGAQINGICTGAIKPKFEHCHLGDVTIPPCHMDICGFEGEITLGSVGAYHMADNCHSGVAGTGTPSIDFGSAVGDSQVNMRGYSGGIELKNMGQVGTDDISIDGDGQVVIHESSIGGTIAIRGHQTITGAEAFEAAGGIISDDARFDIYQIQPNGARQITLQVYETGGTTPLSDASITIWNSDETLVVGRKATDVNGQWAVDLDDGTYTLRILKAGVNFTSSETLTITEDGTDVFYGTPLVIAPPADPDACRVYDYLFLPDGVTKPTTVDATALIIELPYDADGKLHSGTEITEVYDSDTGLIYWDIVQGATVRFDVVNFIETEKVIPSETTARLNNISET